MRNSIPWLAKTCIQIPLSCWHHVGNILDETRHISSIDVWPGGPIAGRPCVKFVLIFLIFWYIVGAILLRIECQVSWFSLLKSLFLVLLPVPFQTSIVKPWNCSLSHGRKPCQERAPLELSSRHTHCLTWEKPWSCADFGRPGQGVDTPSRMDTGRHRTVAGLWVKSYHAFQKCWRYMQMTFEERVKYTLGEKNILSCWTILLQIGALNI